MERRLSFGSVAERYEAARPSYPLAVIEDMVQYARLEPGALVLEIGAGTGKATELMARWPFQITAVEPDPNMARVLKNKLPSVPLINRGFEDANVPEHHYELLYSAQAWHWIDPERRYALAHRALRPGGTLACFWNWPVWEEHPLKPRIDAVYREAGVADRVYGTHVLLGRTDPWNEESEALYTDQETRSYRYERSFTAETFVAMLGTQSDHLSLEPDLRQTIEARIREAVAPGFTLPYETRLCLARARSVLG